MSLEGYRVSKEIQNVWTPTPDPSPQGGGEKTMSSRVNHMSDFIKRPLRLLVLAVIVFTALIAVVPFVFAIVSATAPAAHP
jgi:hypothetical protein